MKSQPNWARGLLPCIPPASHSSASQPKGFSFFLHFPRLKKTSQECCPSHCSHCRLLNQNISKSVQWVTRSPIELFWTANKANHLDDHQPRSRIGSEGLVLRSKHFRLCLDFIGSDFTFELWRKRKLQISNLFLLTKLSFLLLTFQEEIVILYN